MKSTIKMIAIVAICLSSLYAEKPTKENVTRLYVATFERAPDQAGLDYWVNSSGLSLEGIAASFFEQPETQQTYPTGTSNHNFIEAVYQHLFNRDPDTSGWQYWENELNQKHIKKPIFILAIINGALAPTGGKDDASILNNKTEVGLEFVEEGLNDVTLAKDVMSGITADKTTVERAKEKIVSASSKPQQCPTVSPNGDKIYTINLKDKDGDGEFEDYIICQYYDSGKISMESPYTDNEPNGIEKKFYESGQLEFISSSKNGIQDGVEKYYDESGCVTEEYIYEEGTLISSKENDCSNNTDTECKEGEVLVNGECQAESSDNSNYDPSIWTNKPKPQWCPMDNPNRDKSDYKIDKGNADSDGVIKDFIVCNYYDSGKLYYERPYKNSVRSGIEKYYNRDGNLSQETSYKDDKKNGVEKFYNVSGKVYHELTYQDDTLNGIEKYYYISGKVYKEIDYHDGKKNIENIYYTSGELYKNISYGDSWTNHNDKIYNKSGCLVVEDIYEGNTLSNSIDYNCSKYDNSDRMLPTWSNWPNPEHCPMTDSHTDESDFYYNIELSKNLEVTCHYRYGYIVDETYYPVDTSDFQNVIRDKQYYHSGQLLREIPKITFSSIYGVERDYFESGKLEKEIPYNKNGNIDGTYIWYYKNGHQREEEVYQDGKCYMKKWFYETGQISSETPISGSDNYCNLNLINGVNKSYYENGQLKEETPYKDGNRDGIYKFYNDNGQLKTEVSYKNGEYDGTYKEYNDRGCLKVEKRYENGSLLDSKEYECGF